MDRVKKVRIADNLYTIMDEDGRAAVSSEYNENRIYSYGDVVYHDGKLYQHNGYYGQSASGEWDGLYWDEVDVASLFGRNFRDYGWMSIDAKGAGYLEYAMQVSLIEDGTTGINYAESMAYPIGAGIYLSSFGDVDDYDMYYDSSNDYNFGSYYSRELIPAGCKRLYLGRFDVDASWVKFRFIRKDGASITQSDIDKINDMSDVYVATYSTATTEIGLQNITRSEFGNVVHNSYNPVIFSDEYLDYLGDYGNYEPPFSIWSDWIPAEGGALIEVGEMWHYHDWGYECVYQVDAVYENEEYRIKDASTLYGSFAYYAHRKQNAWSVFYPGITTTEDGTVWHLKAIQIAVGRIDGDPIEDIDWPDDKSLFNVYVKSNAETDGISVRRLTPNNKDAVNQFLEIAEGWYDYFPDYAIEQVTYNDVYIGAPTNIDKKSGSYSVGIDSAYFVLCCLKGMTAGSDEWMSWNRDMLLNYKNPDFPWAENPSEYFNNSDAPTEYIGIGQEG